MFPGGELVQPATGSHPIFRALVAAALALTVVAVLAAPVGAQRTAGLDEARERADRATEALAAAETRLGQLDQEISSAEFRARQVRSQVHALEGRLEQAAVTRFVLAGTSPSLFSSEDVVRHLRGLHLGRVATEGAGDVLEDYARLWDDLQVAEEELAAMRAEQDQVLEALRSSREQLLEDLARLEELERQRLAEIERQRIEQERRRQEEAARRAAEEGARRRAEQEAAASAAAAAGAATTSSGSRPAEEAPSPRPGSGDTAAATPPASTPAAAAPAPTSPATTAAPRPAVPTPPRGQLAVCPVAGPHSFIDSWGAPRSGGRRHAGVDMMARVGVPVVAPVPGSVTHRSNSVGGRSFHLRGDDGNTYYGTHLSGYGSSGRVSAGEVIGYVGDDGNARGIPHLHFEVRPGGGSAVNPYPYVAAVCR